ncbi:LOW QUALITY PROTEIN: zinc finger protein 592 [Xiphophorus hellerii]|uniref:LOW QUALITY PROTEIN: zinc finger protein 592 n=1 Tax=Xiphophorus hellerii TaxID=8084 RepID=UPI0013B44957|nr:LOW QUALITY PROTEIN: zinc finger protein 592 [Xiphophorus hellerii]
MGDMKTPDFDDLLAAFDIPDATGLDSKEAIQESHEEIDNQLKHSVICLDDSLLSNPVATTADVPLVSVIVKNTSRQESLEGFSDRLHSAPGLQNGYKGQEACIKPVEPSSTSFSNSFQADLNGESSRNLPGGIPLQQKPDETAVFSPSLSHFSPPYSPQAEALYSKNQKVSKQEGPCCLEARVLVEPLVPGREQKSDIFLFDASPNNTKESTPENGRSNDHLSDSNIRGETENTTRACCPFTSLSSEQNFKETESQNTEDVTNSYSSAKFQTSELPSSNDAPIAPKTKKDPIENTDPKESSASHSDCVKANNMAPISPRSPRSPNEVVKRLMKPSDSPVSLCSDSSGKTSPAVASVSSPAIPRVRIKTIKTTSGQIKRTVTSVLPDSETDEIHSAYESSPSQSMISEDSFCNVSPRQSQAVDCSPRSNPACTSSPKMPRRSEENSRRFRTGFHRSSRPVQRSVAHDVQKPKRVSSTTGHTSNTNFLPKAMHLASLNLVPHSVAASVAARPSSHQQSQHILSSSVCSTVPLVHQVKTATPFPRSSAPNTAAGTLNRLLTSANPVPVYVPNLSPPPECNIKLPPHGYCCLECGDSFGVERSLAFHYNRRSVQIEVGCTHCAKTLVFFNKCALLAHAREHKSNGSVMQCTQLHLKPISEEQMFVPLSSESTNTGPYPSTLVSPVSEPVMPLYPDSVIRNRFRCLECNKQLPDYKALAGHYQKMSEDVEGLICKVCSMLLPNKCSFRTHQRLHAHKSPYCCPECGALSRSADIQKHVKENCLHYARKAWYKCLHCDMVFRTLLGQKSHVEEKHCEILYKCSVCPVAFKTSNGCEVHLKNKHKSSKQAPQLIFKCSCKALFNKKHNFFQHFHENANKRVTCVFKCPECNSVFPQKRLLMQHFKNVHVGNLTAETEKDSKEKEGLDWFPESHPVQQEKSHITRKNTDSLRKKSEQDAKSRVKPRGWTCGECLQCFGERESYVSHMKINHGKSMKKYPCRHCELSFNTATSLRRHIRSEHDGKRRIYSCWYCTDPKTTFTTSVMLKNHISLMHGIKNPDLRQMPKTSIKEFKSPSGKGIISASPVRRRQVDTSDRSDLDAPSAKRLKTQFRCSKCGFITDDSTEFHQHIPQHKTDENTPQCLHCGLCFTSVVSLNRHLFIVHKVKDPKEDEEEQEMRDVGRSAGSAATAHVNDFKPSLDEEPENPPYTNTSDFHLKLKTLSRTDSASPQ